MRKLKERVFESAIFVIISILKEYFVIYITRSMRLAYGVLANGSQLFRLSRHFTSISLGLYQGH